MLVEVRTATNQSAGAFVFINKCRIHLPSRQLPWRSFGEPPRSVAIPSSPVVSSNRVRGRGESTSSRVLQQPPPWLPWQIVRVVAGVLVDEGFAGSYFRTFTSSPVLLASRLRFLGFLDFPSFSLVERGFARVALLLITSRCRCTTLPLISCFSQDSCSRGRTATLRFGNFRIGLLVFVVISLDSGLWKYDSEIRVEVDSERIKG